VLRKTKKMTDQEGYGGEINERTKSAARWRVFTNLAAHVVLTVTIGCGTVFQTKKCQNNLR
jgi:hypothetical protein